MKSKKEKHSFVIKGDPIPYWYTSGMQRVTKGIKSKISTACFEIINQYEKESNETKPKLNGPVEVNIIFYLSPPCTIYEFEKRSKRNKQDLCHYGRPSIVALIKFVEFVLARTVLTHGSVINSLQSTKYYDSLPRTEITVRQTHKCDRRIEK